MKEDQIYWYDHPIQVGVEQDKNEFLYGLRGLEEAFCLKKRGEISLPIKSQYASYPFSYP